jgi:hypothetical protein
MDGAVIVFADIRADNLIRHSDLSPHFEDGKVGAFEVIGTHSITGAVLCLVRPIMTV